MKVSFLVTFYNQESFVKPAIESILSIEKPNKWEILIGDDGSTDRTKEECIKYVENYPDKIFLYTMPRLQSVSYDPVVRLGENKLNLVNHATGDYFCTLDGDDHFIDKRFLLEALDVFSSTPDISVVGFGYKRIIDGIYSKEYVLPRSEIIPRAEYLKSMYIPAGACVFKMYRDAVRMDYLNNSGFFDDSIITANNLYYGDMYSIQRSVYGYRQNTGSIMTSMNMLETYIHNVQGYDLDSNVVRPENRSDVLKRYAWAIIGLYLNKDIIIEQLDSQKIDMYLKETVKIDNSLTYKLLTYDNLDKNSKTDIDKLFLLLAVRNIKFTIKLLWEININRLSEKSKQ